LRVILFAVTAIVSFAQAYAADGSGSHSIAVATFAKSSLIGMQLSVRRAQQQGKIPANVSGCVQSLDDSSFTAVFTTLLAENLSKSELQATEDFFSTSVGHKYAKHGLMQVYTSVGETPPEPLPTFSDAEYKGLEHFGSTTAGEKLIVRKVLESAPARQAIGSRIQTLLSQCRAKKSDS